MDVRRILTGAATVGLLVALGGAVRPPSAVGLAGGGADCGLGGGKCPGRAAAVTADLLSATGQVPAGCTPTWKSVAAPDWLGSQVFRPGIDVIPTAPGPASTQRSASATGVRVSLLNAVAPWMLDWNGTSFDAMPPIPHAPYESVPGGDFSVSAHSFDAPGEGWVLGPGFASGGGRIPRNSDHAVRWHGGRWTITPLAPSQAPASVAFQTLDVASISATDAWVVGDSTAVGIGVVAGGTTLGALVEHWDGVSWSVYPNPASKQPGAVLAQLAVVSPTDMWAVGRTGTGDGTTPLVEHWDGTSWSVVAVPAGTGRSALNLVSADRAGDVWAAGGQTQPGTNVATGLIEQWDGNAWHIVPGLPDLGVRWVLSGGTGLGGIYAASPTDVWVTGPTPTVGITGRFVHYDGHAWTAVPLPDPPEYGLNYHYDAIDGSGPDDVWAAGRAFASGGYAVLRIAHLSCGPK
ncbi:MAG: hypothetical protein J2P15_07040 [Micromonosporaceae bacterium]|nr:hypothetical protein [Micromonosporaceae bacterium]